jgi:hypothetical protein
MLFLTPILMCQVIYTSMIRLKLPQTPFNYEAVFRNLVAGYLQCNDPDGINQFVNCGGSLEIQAPGPSRGPCPIIQIQGVFP